MILTQLTPPFTKREPIEERIHGVDLVDEYRWLEDQNSEETRAWLQAQSEHTTAYFALLPSREIVRKRVSELLSCPWIGEVWNARDDYFYTKRNSEGEQPVIVRRTGPFGQDIVLIDRATTDSGNSHAVSIAAVSEDGRFVAYETRCGGTDHATIEILDTTDNSVLTDSLPEGFCTGFEFSAEGDGFFYTHRKLGSSHSHRSAVLFHRLGTDPSQDTPVFSARGEDHLSLGFAYAHELKRMVYSALIAGQNRCTSLHIQDLPHGNTKLLVEIEQACAVPFFICNQLLAVTDLDAENFRIVRIDPNCSAPGNWRTIVPESSCRITQFAAAGDKLFVKRVDRFSNTIERFGLDGTREGFIPVQKHGTVNLLSRTSRTSRLFFTYESLTDPPTTYCYDVPRDELLVWQQPSLPFDGTAIEVEETDFQSNDGTVVPVFLAARKELLNAGPLPAFMTGYGGFGASATPRFSAFVNFLLEQGFLFAVPAVRGGSELGEQWHKAGRGTNRQNAFDDFIAAAEWLVSSGRAEQSRIAIGGGSNAGLMVGAVVTQRPEVFRAGVCLGPLLDMLRYHQFDSAAEWKDEFGSADNENDFHVLLAYSPYHRVRHGVRYPALLFISGDADCRCNPMHARKMVARLQAANANGNAILLDYRADWGHTPVQPLTAKIGALTNRLSFVCHELGAEVRGGRPA